MRFSRRPASQILKWAPVIVGAVALWGFSCSTNPSFGSATVEIVPAESGYELLLNGNPYFIRGAVGNQNLDSLLAAGGNSIRRVVIESSDFSRAERLGLTVMAGLEVDSLPEGTDFSNLPAVEQLVETVRSTVQRFREESSLLVWALGDGIEAELSVEQRVQRWEALERIAEVIRQEDQKHPVISIVSVDEIEYLDEMMTCCPELDVVGINAKEMALDLPATLAEAGWEGAYIVTELGPDADWSLGATQWGAPIQPDSTTRANVFLEGYEAAVAEQPNSLGAYAAHWPDERTPPHFWQGAFLPDGSPTATLGAVTFEWSGAWPVNRSPEIGPGKIVVTPQNEVESTAEGTFVPGATLHCAVDATDPEGDALIVKWELRPDSAGGSRAAAATEAIEGAVITSQLYRSVIRLPDAPGRYRVFAFVYDSKGSAAVVNVPISTEAGS